MVDVYFNFKLDISVPKQTIFAFLLKLKLTIIAFLAPHQFQFHPKYVVCLFVCLHAARRGRVANLSSLTTYSPQVYIPKSLKGLLLVTASRTWRNFSSRPARRLVQSKAVFFYTNCHHIWSLI
jgi:hypothetical protein